MKLFKHYFLLLIGFFITNSLIKADDFSVKFGGFVKTDIYYDTRQSFGLREQHIYMWPLDVKTDGNNQDINDEASFHILPIQTRVFMNATGPGIFGGKTSGYIEGEFLGSTDASINSLRLRHAFVDLDFNNTKIRVGQFWHPMFATENFPEVLSFNTGVPTIPFNRSPQIRISQKIDNFTLMVAAVGQRDFANQGPAGTSNTYMRNAGFPELVVGTSYSSADFKAGITASTKTIKPYTTYIFPSTFPGNWPPTDFKVDDKLTTYSASAYARVKIENFHIKTQATYGENLSEFLMIGGYGVTNIDSSILVVSENGFGKRSLLGEYRITNRGGKGVKTLNITPKTGPLIAMVNVLDTDDLMIINKSGLTIRMSVAELREMGRATQGVRLINLKSDDKIAAVTKIKEDAFNGNGQDTFNDAGINDQGVDIHEEIDDE